MAKELQIRNSSTSIRSIPLRSAWTVLGVGILLLLAVTTARSQEEKAPKPPTYTVLYTFTGGADGAGPFTEDLILDRAGNLYGTTIWGGDLSSADCGGSGCGVVFKLDPAGKETVLYTFTGGADGVQPFSVIRDEKGNLYGTAVGGPDGWGEVFKLDRAGSETLLYAFTGAPDGGGSQGVIRGSDGSLYGTTSQGGVNETGCYGAGCGTVFKLDWSGKETVLYSFTGGADGGLPEPSLVQDEEGNLYGVTDSGGTPGNVGGTSGNGVVFKLAPDGKETVLYSFTGGADGALPRALIRDWDGTLYGVTAVGGDESSSTPRGSGVVFKRDRSGRCTALYSFTGGMDGANPVGTPLLVGKDLYGTTANGGNSAAACGGPCGVVFKVDATGKETVLHSFTGPDGENPYGGLIADAQGNLIGTATYGGDLANQAAPCYGYGCGVVFKLTLHEDCKGSEKGSEVLPTRID
jgi:uncharacterized repeat protein (TIGR03803 family)